MASDQPKQKKTEREILEESRRACLQTPCRSAGTLKGCPFCPQWAKKEPKK